MRVGCHARNRIASALLIAAVLFGAAGGPAVAWNDGASQSLKANVEALETRARGAQAKSAAAAVKAFYEDRDFQPIWYTGSGLSRRAMMLFTVLRGVDAHGLDPAHYGMPGIVKDADTRNADAQARMELRLSRILIQYAGDLSAGSIKPSRAAPGVYRKPERPGPTQILSEAADSGNFRKYLASLEPRSRRYAQLKVALAKYRAYAAKGGWPAVAPGPTLKPGMKDARVSQAKMRLMVTGELASMGADPTLYDDDLKKAVTAFQERHGLTPDGSIGRNTLAELNVPVHLRIEQLVINIERRRWMPNDLGQRYVWVNIADFNVKLVEGGKTVHTARIVVGKTYTKTPIFSSTMKWVQFNPKWNVPFSIASKEMLPKIKKDPGYLSRNGYRLYGKDGKEIDPGAVDWADVSRRNFRYFIRQNPGRSNALGTVVFMFPNRFNVFLHDTNSRHLFGRTVRSFSHGCMRVQFPHKFAIKLLKGKDGWTMDRIRRIVSTEKPTTVYLPKPIPVHVTYITAWANKDGSVHFRRDIYRRDQVLARALNRKIGRRT